MFPVTSARSLIATSALLPACLPWTQTPSISLLAWEALLFCSMINYSWKILIFCSHSFPWLLPVISRYLVHVRTVILFFFTRVQFYFIHVRAAFVNQYKARVRPWAFDFASAPWMACRLVEHTGGDLWIIYLQRKLKIVGSIWGSFRSVDTFHMCCH